VCVVVCVCVCVCVCVFPPHNSIFMIFQISSVNKVTSDSLCSVLHANSAQPFAFRGDKEGLGKPHCHYLNVRGRNCSGKGNERWRAFLFLRKIDSASACRSSPSKRPSGSLSGCIWQLSEAGSDAPSIYLEYDLWWDKLYYIVLLAAQFKLYVF